MNIRERIKEKLGDKITGWEEVSNRRVYFSLNSADIFDTVQFLYRDLGLRFSIASSVDTPAGFEILYHFSHDSAGEFYSVRVLIADRNNPEIDSIAPIMPAAEWIEREMWEMMGIKFKGHPNLKRLLLSEDWPEGNYPLRKQK